MSENEDKYHDIVIDLEARAKKNENIVLKMGLRATSGVRRPSIRYSSLNNSVLSNTKNPSEKVEVFDRSNKKSDVASKNVNSNKKIVTNDDIKNALIAKNVLCVSYIKNVLIPCHDNCLAKYKLNVHSKVKRALFTTFRTIQSKFKYPTPVVSKTRFSVKTVQSKSLVTTPVVSKTKIVTVTPLSAKHKVVQIVLWIVDSGDDLLTGDRKSNLYTISISDMSASLPVCLMFKATSINSWLWYRRLSHLNFGTINDLTKHDLVDGLSKFKYKKDHLCPACKRGKSKKASHPPKVVPSNHSKLEFLHMDLCGTMWVASINRNRSMNTPSKEDLDNLFGPMYEEYFEKSSSESSINFAAQQVYNHEDSPSTSL
ncbi:integrase, catalytic region, zinc finger, CCHC-type containing protein [Tanacetum coccineum]